MVAKQLQESLGKMLSSTDITRFFSQVKSESKNLGSLILCMFHLHAKFKSLINQSWISKSYFCSAKDSHSKYQLRGDLQKTPEESRMTLTDRFEQTFYHSNIFSSLLPSFPTPIYSCIFYHSQQRGRRKRNDLTEFLWAETLSSFGLS